MRYHSMETEEIKGFKKRLSILSMVAFLALGILLIRLWQLQIIQNEKYRTLSENNRVRVVPAKNPRGQIKDRNGALLVENRPEFNLYVVPGEVPDMEALLARLKGKIFMDKQAVKKRLAYAGRFQPVLIKRDLSLNELAYVEEHRLDLPGTFSQVDPVRYYKYGPLAAHLLGHLGEVGENDTANGSPYLPGDQVGRSGLEKSYEAALRGQRGRKFIEVDALGREIRALGDLEPSIGDTLILTIDLELQALAEDLLDGERGAIVAMDPRDGQVLAYVSIPSFDPNLFASGLRREDWIALANDKTHPLQDRVLQGQYPPGSVFKIIMAIAALEEGVIDENTTFYCPGYYYFGGRRYNDWKKEGHGMVNVHRALVESSDVFFYRVGEKLGVDTINRYATGFGLGRTLGVVLEGEKPGLIPSSSWKKNAVGEPWYPGETLSIAIGQGYVLVTPLQLAVMISAMANGGTLYLPQFVRRIEDVDGLAVKEFRPQVLGSIPATPKTLSIVRNALGGVVNEPHGTGYRARLPGIQVAGKTGTAQVLGLERGDGSEDGVPRESRDHAWFVSFAPLESPTVAVVVFVENAGKGGSKYAHIAAKLIAARLGLSVANGLNGE